MSDEIKVYTLQEIADILHITRRCLYNYVREGKLKAIKLGHEWRVTQKSLEEFLNKGTKD